jgi:hypothetical protein
MVLCFAAGPAGAVTAISGSVNAAVEGTIGVFSDPAVVDLTDQHTDSAAGLPTTLSASASVLAQRNGDSVSVRSTDTATWQSASRGNLVSSGSWDMSMLDLANQNETAGLGGHPFPLEDWNYSFTVANAGFITFDYDVTSTGQTFGVGGWAVRSRQAGVFGQTFSFLTNNIVVDDPAGFVEASGSLIIPLVAGGTYTFTLENESNVGVGSGIFTRHSATSSDIEWRITDVPEPSTWAMLIVGFGGVGASLRRRQTKGAFDVVA